MLATIPSRNVKSTKYQYSERRARPLKSTYLEKQVRTAVMKSMDNPLISGGAEVARQRQQRRAWAGP